MTIHGTSRESDELTAVEQQIIKKAGQKVKVHKVIYDLRQEDNCILMIQDHMKTFGKLDAL